MKRAALLVTALMLSATLGAQPASASFPGRNGRIAFSTDLRRDAGFSGGIQIYTVARDGTRIRQLTHVDADHIAEGPDWSSNGRKIVYSSDQGGNMEIWKMRSDGSNQTQLTDDPGFAHKDAAWSPNGRHIVFVRCDQTLYETDCPLFTIRADGTGMRKLIGGNWVYAHPEYSPGGNKIAFDSNRNGYIGAVWTVRIGGTHLKRLTPVRLEGFGPDWSPDGSHMVFTSYCCQARSDIWKMRADGSRLTRLTRISERGRQAGFADYSPNGDRIVFSSNLRRSNPDSPKNDLFKMRLDGTHIRPLVTNHPYAFRTDWGPRRRS